jgi:hypothetical protein
MSNSLFAFPTERSRVSRPHKNKISLKVNERAKYQQLCGKQDGVSIKFALTITLVKTTKCNA